MTNIWEALLKADEQGFPRERIRFIQADTPSPYAEVSFSDVNRQHVNDEPVQVNAYYRYSQIFDKLLDGLDDYSELRDILFDVLVHYLAAMSTVDGLCNSEYHGRFLREDIQTGMFGRQFRQALEAFPHSQIRFVVEGMVRLYTLGSSLILFRTIMRQLYQNSIIYLDIAERRELLIYIGAKETPELKRQVDFLLALFVPFDYGVQLFWNMHFGIMGVDETMMLGEFVVY